MFIHIYINSFQSQTFFKHLLQFLTILKSFLAILLQFIHKIHTLNNHLITQQLFIRIIIISFQSKKF